MKLGKKNQFPYKLARLVESPKGWYVVYYMWNVDTNQLIRIRDSVKGNTDVEKRADAEETIREIDKMLLAGFYLGKPANPTPSSGQDALNALITFSDATQYYFAAKRDLSEDTRALYKGYLKRFTSFLEARGKATIRLRDISPKMMFEFFDGLELSSKTRNDYLGFLIGFFNFYVSRQVLKETPIKEIEKDQVEDSDDHKPFTADQAQRMQEEILATGDAQLWLFCQFIYFTFARPGQELRLLKVGDILTHQIRISAKRGKTNRVRYPEIPPALEESIKEMGIRNYPPSYYVFSADKTPGAEPAGKNYFYKRHRKILERIGLYGQDYDLYSWKPTGVIALYQATRDIKLIQHQCGHTTIDQTDTYLKKLGLFFERNRMVNFPTPGKSGTSAA